VGWAATSLKDVDEGSRIDFGRKGQHSFATDTGNLGDCLGGVGLRKKLDVWVASGIISKIESKRDGQMLDLTDNE